MSGEGLRVDSDTLERGSRASAQAPTQGAEELWAFNFTAEPDACSCTEMGVLFTKWREAQSRQDAEAALGRDPRPEGSHKVRV